MRILFFTAGAAGMYCGSCLRDNALAAELKAQGHDVILIPLYTPTLTDEPNVSEPRVFFGGISVYLQQHSSIFRKTPWLLDRVWDSKLAIRAATRYSLSTDPKLLGELTVSMLRGEDGLQAKEFQKLSHWVKGLPTPDVLSLPTSLLIGLARPLAEALGRPIVCTFSGEDLFLDGLEPVHRERAEALIRENARFVDAFIGVSDYGARSMAERLGMSMEKVHVVPLGIRVEGFEPRRDNEGSGRPFTVGYFARIAPEKGLHHLVAAYRHLRERSAGRPARLEVAGYLGPEHRGYFGGVEAKLEAWGLSSEFRYHGTLDRAGKGDFLRTLDVLSVPSPYREPKGIYLLEAMACGVPVVQPRHGAFPEVIEKTSGGVLVDSLEPDVVAEGILSLWNDPARRAELARNAAAGVRAHFTAAHMADRAARVFSAVATATTGARRA